MPPKGHGKKGGGYYGETFLDQYLRTLSPGYKGPETVKPDLGLGGGPTKFGPVLVQPPKKKKKKKPTTTPVTPTRRNNTTTPTTKPTTKKPTTKKPTPKPLTLEQYLRGDVDYQQQLRDLNRTAAQFLSEITRQKGKVAGEYETSKKKLGTQRGRDLGALKDDFSGRGLLFSGLYGNKVGEYEQDYQTALGDLERQRSNLLGDIAAEQNRYELEKKMTEEQARREAIRRRAAKAGKS